jgi:hypothetical protein
MRYDLYALCVNEKCLLSCMTCVEDVQVDTHREPTGLHPGNLHVTEPAPLITEIPSPTGKCENRAN